jgi:predicted ester cyclase
MRPTPRSPGRSTTAPLAAEIESTYRRGHDTEVAHKGPQAFETGYAKPWFDAFSDAEVTEAQYHDAGDTVVAEFVGRGTNDGSFGPLPPTNRQVSHPFCEIYHFGSDGKIIGGRAYLDMYGMLVQLGHAEPPPGS